MIISGNEDNKMGIQDIAIVNVADLDRETKDTYSLKVSTKRPLNTNFKSAITFFEHTIVISKIL